MFAEAGFPEAETTREWSDGMVDAVVVWGDEGQAGSRLRELFDWGVGEIIAHVIPVGEDRTASRERTLTLLADTSAKL